MKQHYAKKALPKVNFFSHPCLTKQTHYENADANCQVKYQMEKFIAFEFLRHLGMTFEV